MSMLGIFWVCSVVVSYGVGMYLGMYLSKPKSKIEDNYFIQKSRNYVFKSETPARNNLAIDLKSR